MIFGLFHGLIFLPVILIIFGSEKFDLVNVAKGTWARSSSSSTKSTKSSNETPSPPPPAASGRKSGFGTAAVAGGDDFSVTNEVGDGI